jgi:predicted permease
MPKLTTTVREIAARIRGLFAKQVRDADLDDEMAAHIDLLAAENVRRGMSQQEAWYAARREFGGMEQIKETYRDRRGLPMLESFLNDLRYGARMLRKNPVFAAVASLTLALGIGASTAIFTIISALIFQTLPYPHPDQLVLLQRAPTQINNTATSFSTLPIDWADRVHSFQGITGYYSDALGVNLQIGDHSEHATWAEVQPNFFDVLGVRLALGRELPNSQENAHIVMSYAMWQNDFGGDPSLIGGPVSLSGRPYTLEGIAPKGFSFPSDTQVWVLPSVSGGGKVIFFQRIIARLKDGVSIPQAQNEMHGFSQIVEKLAGRRLKPIEVVPLAGFDATSIRSTLLLLLGAAGMVLLIACANVANLNFSRVANRRREFAVRMAIGAGRARLVRQLLVESVILGLVGGAAGLLLAYWGVAAVRHIGNDVLPRASEIHPDFRVLLFALTLSILTGVISGLLPALRAMRANPAEALQESGSHQSASRQRVYVTRILVVAEIALALLLVVGAGLLVRSFVRVLQVPPGYDANRVVTTSIVPISVKTRETPNRPSPFGEMLDRIAAIPGVEAAAAATQLPLKRETAPSLRFVLVENPREMKEGGDDELFFGISPDYFRVMGIPLERGRAFNASDTEQSSPVVVVSRTLADRYWPGQEVIGKHIALHPYSSTAPTQPREIVGVVADVKPFALERLDGAAQVYLPYQQAPLMVQSLAVRSSLPPSQLATEIRKAINQVDPGVAPYNVRTMNDLLSASRARRRLILLMLATMAGLALTLGAVGIFAMTSNTVTLRVREIGIRMALGAQPQNVLRMVLGQSLRLAVAGIIVGIAAAIAATRLLTSMLFGIRATDPITFVAVACGLAAVTLLAAYLPARRATRVDPSVTLRYE